MSLLLSLFLYTVILSDMLPRYLFLSLSWAECRWYRGCQVFCSPPIFNYKSLIVDKVKTSRPLDLGLPLLWQRSSWMSCLSLLIGDANVPEVTLAHPWVYILTRRLHGTWAVHIRGGLKEINQRNRSAKRVRQFVPPLTLQTMLNSLIQQYFDCYSVVWEVWVQT